MTTTTTNDSWYRWCPRPTRRSCSRSFSSRGSRSRRDATFTEGGRKKKNEFASKGIKPPMQSSSSSSKKTKKTKETRLSDEEKEEKSINETKTNGWRIFDVHIDATEDSG